MNTQTHLLVAAAMLIHAPASTHCISAVARATDFRTRCQRLWQRIQSFVPHTSNRVFTVAVLFGALLPDASLFVMWIQAKFRGIEESRIWSELYYSTFWQQISAISNSIPVFLAIALTGWMLHNRTSFERVNASASSARYSSINQHIGFALAGLGLAAVLHCVTDLPLHVDDGHPHFWPFSAWVYQSPVSYWDTDHYARVWIPVEYAIALLCGVLLWRRFRSLQLKVVLAIALASYPAAFAYWYLSGVGI